MKIGTWAKCLNCFSVKEHMKVNPGAMSSLWIPAGCTGHCRRETGAVKRSKLMMLSFLCLSNLLMCFEKMITWSSGFSFYVCIHL